MHHVIARATEVLSALKVSYWLSAVKSKPNSVMKHYSPSSKRGFTLVELLVVIAIIAVLAGAGFAAGGAAVQKAKKTTALASCVAIESAVNNFYTEYGTMPVDNLSTDTTINSDDLNLLNVLLGTETGSAPLNTRSVKFLSVKEGKANKNGLVYDTSGSTVKGLYDPWGGLYKIALDGDYDEKIKAQPKGSSTSQTLNGRRVAVWSDGADGVSGTGKTADDVTTWK